MIIIIIIIPLTTTEKRRTVPSRVHICAEEPSYSLDKWTPGLKVTDFCHVACIIAFSNYIITIPPFPKSSRYFSTGTTGWTVHDLLYG
jgi:hypothetical protein